MDAMKPGLIALFDVDGTLTAPRKERKMEETSYNFLADQKRYAVVTGANKGIGLEICRQLALGGIIVTLTARDEKRGIKAVEDLNESGLSNVFFHQLDVKDPISIASLAIFIETHFKKLDILVNNAGDNGLIVDEEASKALTVAGGQMKDENSNLLRGIVEETYDRAEECLKTNYYGAKNVTEALLPLLQLSGSPRIVNVSSEYGQLKFISNRKIKEELSNVDCLTVERLDELIQCFLKDFKEGKLQVNGWPITISAYKVSKSALNAYTRILAAKLPGFGINCIKTDFAFNRGTLACEVGASGPVRLALWPIDGPSGLYFDQVEMPKNGPYFDPMHISNF